MFARAPNECSHAANNQNRKCPLHFRGVIAEPKERKRNDDRRRDRDKREPGNLPFVGKPRWSFCFAIHFRGSLLLGSTRASRVAAGALASRSGKETFKEGEKFAMAGRHRQHARARALPRSQTILLEAPVERASTQPECLCSLTRVTVIAGQRFFDQKCLDLFETHLLNIPRFGAASR